VQQRNCIPVCVGPATATNQQGSLLYLSLVLQAMFDAFQEVFAEELAQADRAAEAITQQVRLTGGVQ
jgi:hypothetical protein